MPRLIADGCARFAINGTFAAEPVVNIWDMHVDSLGGSDRDDNMPRVAERILDKWCDHILPMLQNDYTFTDVSWVDLDTADGSTGAITSGADEVLPQSGTQVGSPLPASVAAKVAKVINRTRGKRNGRLYLCGLDEGWTLAGAPNHLTAATQTMLNDAFNAFKNAVNENVAFYNSTSVVLHTSMLDVNGNPIAEPRYVGRSTIQSLKVDALLATQRGRLR